MRLLVWVCWLGWSLFLATAGSLLGWHYGVGPLTGDYLLHAAMTVATFAPLEVIGFGFLPPRLNPAHRRLRGWEASPSDRLYAADLLAFLAFGCLTFGGVVTTVTSRNAFFFVGDGTIALVFLGTYLLQRPSIRKFMTSTPAGVSYQS